MKNWSYTIKDGEHAGTTLWSGRYCAICAIVLYRDENGEFWFLANKRGKGTPDYQGYWNLPCGFLEADESAEEGCVREVYEETGIRILDPKKFELHQVQTEPEKCNNGNVTLRYLCFIKDAMDFDENVDDMDYMFGPKLAELRGGETNEVAEVQWLNADEVLEYKWAFNHKEIIDEILKAIYC